MADGLKDIIAGLENQKAAIEKALDALKQAEGSVGAPAVARARRGRPPGSTKKAAPAPRKGRISPEGRERLAAAMRERWAAKRAGAAVTKAAAKKTKKKAVAAA
jgi:hypothetical protein